MPKHQSQIHRPKGSHVSYEVASARRNENLPAHDLVFHIFHNSSTIARRCDRSPVSLKIFILFSCGKNIQVENEQPTAENYEGFVNKLYLIQPQASQINVRHVGSSYIRESRPSSSFRSVPEINELYRRKHSRKSLLLLHRTVGKSVA